MILKKGRLDKTGLHYNVVRVMTEGHTECQGTTDQMDTSLSTAEDQMSCPKLMAVMKTEVKV